MTIHTALAALSAGLDRDEQLARATLDDWESDIVGGIDVVGTLGGDAYGHVLRQDPARTLRHVEAIQQVLTIVRHQTLLFDSARDRADAERHAFEQGFQAAAGVFIEALAKGYTEDTTETEKP